MALHLLADHVNSHKAEVSGILVGWVLGPPAIRAAEELVELHWARFFQGCCACAKRLHAGLLPSGWPAGCSVAGCNFSFEIADFCWFLVVCMHIFELSCFVSCNRVLYPAISLSRLYENGVFKRWKFSLQLKGPRALYSVRQWCQHEQIQW